MWHPFDCQGLARSAPILCLALFATFLTRCAANQFFYQIPLNPTIMPILPHPPAAGGLIAGSYVLAPDSQYKYLHPRYSLLGMANNGWHKYGTPATFPRVMYWFRIDDSASEDLWKKVATVSLNLAWPSVHPLNFTARTFGYYPRGHVHQLHAEENAIKANYKDDGQARGLLLEVCENPCIKYVSIAPHLETPSHMQLDDVSPVIISLFVGRTPRLDGTAYWAAFYIFVLCISTMVLLFPVIYNLYVSIFERGVPLQPKKPTRRAEIFGLQLPGCAPYSSPADSAKTKEK